MVRNCGGDYAVYINKALTINVNKLPIDRLVTAIGFTCIHFGMSLIEPNQTGNFLRLQQGKCVCVYVTVLE